MHKELTQQATRLGLIFARYGIKLSRAEKLELTAEIHGEKSWAVLAGLAKKEDTSAGTAPSMSQSAAQAAVERKTGLTPFTPLQRIVVEHFGSGDFSHYLYAEEVHPGDDTLFEYVLKEALEARENPADFAGMLRTAIHDLESVKDRVEASREEARTSAIYFNTDDNDDYHAETMTVFSDGKDGVRHMSALFDEKGERIKQPDDYPLTTSYEWLDENARSKARLFEAVRKLGVPLVTYEGQCGVLVQKKIFELAVSSKKADDARSKKVLKVLQRIEELRPGCVGGTIVDLREEGERYEQFVDAWVFVPDSSHVVVVAEEVQEALNTLS